MREKIGTDLKYITLLLVIAAIIGVFLIGGTVVVSKDTCLFIEHSKAIRANGYQSAFNYYTQHSGYPILIFGMNNLLFGEKPQPFVNWIFSAQLVTFICWILSVIPFYLIARLYVSSQKALIAGIVVLALPIATHNGCDGLSDYVHLFFVYWGYYFLLWGSVSKKWGLFAAAGLFSGMAYLIRPEGLQVVVCGIIWLLSQLAGIERRFRPWQTVSAAILLVVCCAVVIAPYVYMEGGLFQKKNILHSTQNPDYACGNITEYKAQIVGWEQFRAAIKVNERISAVHHWYFFPIALVGFVIFFVKNGWKKDICLYAILIYAINIAICSLLYLNYGYISPRHTFCIAILLCIFIPDGAMFIGSIFDKNVNSRLWLWIIAPGLIICLPKLLAPLGDGQTQLLETADWVRANTTSADIVAIADPRIELYSGKDCIMMYDDVTLPEKYNYVITLKPVKDPKSQDLELITEFKAAKACCIYRNIDPMSN